jgi:hypothetical protein
MQDDTSLYIKGMRNIALKVRFSNVFLSSGKKLLIWTPVQEIYHPYKPDQK